MPSKVPEPCLVCDSGKAEAVDQLLWAGDSYRLIATTLEWGPEAIDAIKWHHLNGHVKHFTLENYTIAMVRFSQENRNVKARELQKSSDRQRPSVLDRVDKNYRWMIDSLCRVEGLYSNNKNPKSILDALGDLAKLQPETVKRLQAHQRPINTESTPVEVESGE